MGKIHVLDKTVSNMIAAGEVVSRPASAVKELLENAFDAESKAVTVEIKNGGISYIRVTDDGVGIEEDDVLTAFMPHATSKISAAADLEKIQTYGFRGEALASISAVSRTEITTKTADAECAIKLQLAGGEVTGSDTVGAKNGTSIVVRDIFYNMPARFKFLKKDASEAAAVTDVCQKAALSRPDISLRYISSGKEMFHTPGDGNLLNCIFAVFGGDFSKHMLPVEYADKGIRVSGYIGTARVARPNRNMQIFFVNGRSVVSKVMSFALAESYKNQLTVGRFASAVLNVTVDPASVDVNVHPAKTEVKFTDEKTIYDAVYWGAKNTLYEKPYTPEFEAKTLKTEDKQPSAAQDKGGDAQNAANISVGFRPVEKAVVAPIGEWKKASTDNLSAAKGGFAPACENAPITGFTPLRPIAPVTEKIMAEPKTEYRVTPTESKNAEEPVQQCLEIPEESYRVIGQIFGTYIISEKGNEMFLIDQHAAHERLNYEALKEKREKSEPTGQMLLIPEIVTLEPEEMVTWEENKGFLNSIGFETEQMGERDVMVRSTPNGTDAAEAEDVISEVLTILADKRHDKRTYLEERAMYSVSCKAAIKANMHISLREQEALVNRVMSMQGINTCPHGRPICIKITKEKIEKEFKRT